MKLKKKNFNKNLFEIKKNKNLRDSKPRQKKNVILKQLSLEIFEKLSFLAIFKEIFFPEGQVTKSINKICIVAKFKILLFNNNSR